MKIYMRVLDEHSDCSEGLNFTSEGFLDILKNNPQRLVELIEDIEKRFPPPRYGGKSQYKSDSSTNNIASISAAISLTN